MYLILLILLILFVTYVCFLYKNIFYEHFNIHSLAPLYDPCIKTYKDHQLPWCKCWKNTKPTLKCYINKHLQRKCYWSCNSNLH